MAGYTNNYAGYDSPEYQQKPNADSTNGTYGSNTPAARQNQQNYASTANQGGQADPYERFAAASRQWWPKQAKPKPVTTPPTPQLPPSNLSSLLRGRPVAVAPQTVTTPPPADAVPQTAAQPSSVAIPPSAPPQMPSVIPPVPVMDAAPPSSSLASTLRGGVTALSSGVEPNAPNQQQTPDQTTAGATPAPPVAQPTSPPAATPQATEPAPTTGQQNAPPPTAPPSSTRGHASTPGDQFTDQQLGDIYRSGQTFTPAQQAILDRRNPKPTNIENDLGAYTRWLQGFAFIDPSFANITSADVNNQRALAVSGAFERMGHPEYQDVGKWFLAGRPGGQYAPDPTGPPTVANHNPGGGSDPGNVHTAPGGLPWDPITGAPITPAGTTPPGTTAPPPPVVDPVVPAPGGAGQPTAASYEDTASRLYDPLFKQQQTELARTLRAQAAIDGTSTSGGFAETLGRAESNLSANQGAQKVALIEAAQNRQQAMTIAVMQDATQRFGIKTNDDLQRWLNDPNNNTLQKYGIDKNDLLERYKAQLGLQSSETMAGASFNAAALSAATQAAIAAGNNATQLKLGQMSNDLGWGQLQGNLYNSDQDRYVAELKILTDAGISSSVIAQILAAFGPSNPIYTTHP